MPHFIVLTECFVSCWQKSECLGSFAIDSRYFVARNWCSIMTLPFLLLVAAFVFSRYM